MSIWEGHLLGNVYVTIHNVDLPRKKKRTHASTHALVEINVYL